MFWYAPRPPLQSFADGPATVFWVAVTAWIVLIKPSSIPNLSFSTLAIGAKQLVVHEAFETIVWSAFNWVWLTPITKVGVSSFAGALITTFLAPASICFWAVSWVRNKPVDSITTSAPTSLHLRLAGSFSAVTRIVLPFTTKCPPSTAIVPLKGP